MAASFWWGRMTFEFRIRTRWNDFDALGHLNHAVYHVYLDEARDDALRRTVGDFDAWPNVLVHVSIDYLREITLGTREVVRTEIDRGGRTLERAVRAGGARARRASWRRKAEAVLVRRGDPEARGPSRTITADAREGTRGLRL